MAKKTGGKGAKRGKQAGGSAPKGRKRTRGGVAFPRPFTVRDSPVQGKGGFALRWIQKGERIVEYVGERIPHDVADARYDDDTGERHHTFLFSVDDDTVIDAAVDGNEARFINHSCDPNCEAVDHRGRIYIEAIRDIAPGEELFYDYNFELDEEITPALLSRYPCRCGATGCRGTILALKEEPEKKARKKKKKKKKEKDGKKKQKGSGGAGKKKGRKRSGKK